jgi:hypothetical protein
MIIKTNMISELRTMAPHYMRRNSRAETENARFPGRFQLLSIN